METTKPALKPIARTGRFCFRSKVRLNQAVFLRRSAVKLEFLQFHPAAVNPLLCTVYVLDDPYEPLGMEPGP